MKLYKCDRCGVEISQKDSFNGNVRLVCEYVDLCPECMTKLKDFLKPLPPKIPLHD